MKKILSLTTVFLISIQSVFAEYTVFKDIVYEVNIDNLTATVLNFQTSVNELVKISIPSEIVYKNEIYTVTKLSYNAFDFDALKSYATVAQVFGIETANSLYSISDGSERENIERKFRYEYPEARANIVELYLPKTLKEIDSNAFKGMTRIKTLRIPSQVNNFSKSSFDGNVRLENITFEGVPHICHEYKAETLREFPWARWDTICLDDVSNPQIVIDSVKFTLTHKSWLEKAPRCPRLQTIEVLPLKNFFIYTNRLNDTISVYERKIKQHPYYVELDEGFFSDIKIFPSSNDFKIAYNNALIRCREKYSFLTSDMETICKKKDPEFYAEKYCALHPDFSEQIDIMLNDYKCKYTKNELAKLVLLKYNLGEKCQDELWREYEKLYKSNEDFLKDYYNSINIRQELENRQNIYNDLKDLIQSSKLSVKGFKGYYDSSEDNYLATNFRAVCDKMKEAKIPVSKQILSLDQKAQKEYDKNSKFFDSPDEFFRAYITKDYSLILDAKKRTKARK